MAKAGQRKIEKQAAIVVVGIGASAGGLRALKEFFANVKEASHVSVLVALHLDTSGKKLALESLRRLTKLPVNDLKAGDVLRPGNVYAVPPHMMIAFADSRIALTEAETTPQKLAVIDSLLTALGEEFKERAVGIILSGDASDGAQGIRSINECGGLTLVQTPESAEHKSMPESAIATGAADHILSAEDLWKEVASYADYILPTGSAKIAFKDQIGSSVSTICEILLERTKHDFRHYKTSTLLRRIQRRMQVLQLSSVDQYIDVLQKAGDESEVLFKELLINVTAFFRDGEAFVSLSEEVLKPLLKSAKVNEKLRIWVPGCSTGEEPYTIAILVRELLDRMSTPPEVQIIATDIDDVALGTARRGVYASTIAEHLTQERLSKHFIKRAGKFHVSKAIREMVLFSIHNLITDPPFSQLDLISCRNVMIYFGPHLQQKLFPVFHYALRPSGYLFLGTSETFTSHRELFKPVNSKHRIAQRKSTAIKLPPISSSVQNYLSHFHQGDKVSEADLSLIGQRIALDEMPLRYAVINDEAQILSSSAGIGKYVHFPEGAFQNNIVKLVLPSLRAALRSALNRAKKEKRKITNDSCTVRTPNAIERTCVIVQPMPQLGDLSDLYWVAFQSMGTVVTKEVNQRLPSESDVELVDQLEKELSILREELDKSVQDLEASNEELKSSNEELLSMNEELQSANEELETSKEEVQSANDALQRSNSDLENLLASTEIATLFLDDNSRIQNFTPQLTSIYNISRVDIGRAITDITSRAKSMLPIPDPTELAATRIIEHDIDFGDGRRILRRVTPYQTSEGNFSGIVVTFIDVTHLRVAEALRKESEARFQIMADSAPVLVWISGKDGKRNWFNKGWLDFTGQSPVQALSSWHDVIHPDDLPKYLKVFETNFAEESAFHIEYRLRHVSGNYRWISARGVPRVTLDGSFEGFIGACLDIDEQKTAAEKLRESDTKFQTLIEVIPQLVWTCLPNGDCDYLSKQWEDYTGIAASEQLGFLWLDRVIHPQDRERVLSHWMGAVSGIHAYDINYRLRRHDGEFRWFQTRGTPIRNRSAEISKWFGTCTDIHDLLIAQEKISSSAKRLEMTIKTSPSFMCLLTGAEYIFEQANEHYYQLVGHRDIIGKPVFEVVPEAASQGFRELLDRVRTTGEPYIGKDMPIWLQRKPNAPQELRYIDFVYQPAESISGETTSIFVHGVDVTEKAEARLLIENERENLTNLFKQTPEMVCILRGPEHRFEFVNEAHAKVLGFDATGKTVREAQPESVEVHGILDDVYRTGKTAELFEIPITVGSRLRYFNLTYAARRNFDGVVDGIMILGTEVTVEVLAREGLKLQRKALELALDHADLPSVLSVLTQLVERQVGGSLKASILLANESETHLLHGAAPGLPNEYNQAVHGIKIGSGVGSCGTAAFLKEPVYVSDISVDPFWVDYKELALSFQLRACWSIPILTSSKRLLGTFAVYSTTPRKPTDHEIQFITIAAQTTALIIERQHDLRARLESAKESERLLRILGERSAQLETMLESLPLSVTLAEAPSGQLIRANREFVNVWREPLREVGSIESYHEYRAFHPDGRKYEPVDWPLARAIRHGETVVNEDTDVLLGDGTRGILRLSAAPVKDSSGTIVGGVVLAENVTLQKQAELDLKKAKLEAENANVAKTRFLANMSHEIRTPLSAIVGFSDLLRSRMKDDPEGNAFIERIARNSNQLSRLIDELLDLSKIEAEKFEVDPEPVDLDSLIEDVQSAMVLRASDKGIDLQFNWTSAKPQKILSDAGRLSQILINVVGNAVKFTESGSVKVDFSSTAELLTVRIEDTGIGLTAEQQDKIFEPFMQADASVSRKYGGTGLGLALSKRLAKLLGGDLLLSESRIGTGSTFVITVSTNLQAENRITATADKTPVDDISNSLQGIKILVVDDSPDNRLIVNLYLKAVGASVDDAINGEDGVKKATEGQYHVVLMDIQMPVCDGYEAIRRLRELNYSRPVLALTAHAFKEEKDRCISAGFADYVTKPINRSALVKIVGDYASKAFNSH